VKIEDSGHGARISVAVASYLCETSYRTLRGKIIELIEGVPNIVRCRSRRSVYISEYNRAGELSPRSYA
jgi:hypothetical protein